MGRGRFREIQQGRVQLLFGRVQLALQLQSLPKEELAESVSGIRRQALASGLLGLLGLAEGHVHAGSGTGGIDGGRVQPLRT